MRVYRDSLGHWYASFVVPTTTETFPETGAVIGIDWGVKETATTTSGDHDLPHAEHGKKAAAKLAHHQRMMARRRRPKGKVQSKGYRQAQKQAAKLYKKIARQRQDTGRTWAKRVVRDHDALAVEDFKPKFLAKSTMARKAADAATGATKKALIEMGRKHGPAVESDSTVELPLDLLCAVHDAFNAAGAPRSRVRACGFSAGVKNGTE